MRVAHNSKLTIQNSQFKTHNSKLTIQNCHRQQLTIQNSKFKNQKRRQTLSTSVCLLYYFFSDLLSKKITQQRSPQP